MRAFAPHCKTTSGVRLVSPAAIDPRTIRAYRETEYRVFEEPPFSLHVDRFSAPLRRAQHRRNVGCSAFVTAWNPFSRILDPAANAARQRRLAEELGRARLAFVPGIGLHPTEPWPGEESFLVYGLDLDTARAMGSRLEQNAILWSGDDAIPRLILCGSARPDDGSRVGAK